MDITCPKPAALTSVEKVTCFENLGQIQRWIFQRPGHVFDVAGTPTPNPITALASWTPLWVAVDDTKIVTTPLLEGVEISESEAVTESGGTNATLDGAEILLGGGPVTVMGKWIMAPSKIIKQLRELMDEPGLVVFMINQSGKIIARDLDPENPGDEVVGIPLAGSPFFPYKGNKGFNTRDTSTPKFPFAEEWAKDLVMITPDFDAKTLLYPA